MGQAVCPPPPSCGAAPVKALEQSSVTHSTQVLGVAIKANSPFAHSTTQA